MAVFIRSHACAQAGPGRATWPAWVAVAALGLAGQGRSSLQQLVLVVADGRFHEREALQRAVREVSACAESRSNKSFKLGA